MTLKITITKAPVGPPTCTREPPSAAIRNPATTAVIRPLSGEAPLAMPSAMASGKATMATVSPASASARKSARPYPSRKTVKSLGVKPSGTATLALPRAARFGAAPQANAAPAPLARRVLADQFDARAFERVDHFHQRI